jgi:hypothetical protein
MYRLPMVRSHVFVLSKKIKDYLMHRIFSIAPIQQALLQTFFVRWSITVVRAFPTHQTLDMDHAHPNLLNCTLLQVCVFAQRISVIEILLLANNQ